MAFSWATRNSLPMVKAMKPRAVWEMISSRDTDSGVVKPMPVTSSAPSR